MKKKTKIYTKEEPEKKVEENNKNPWRTATGILLTLNTACLAGYLIFKTLK